MKKWNRRECLMAASLGWVLSPLMGLAQSTANFPNRPIKIIAPVPAGGASDTAARVVAQALGASLGQPVIVDNRPGANGLLAIQALLAAPADGHTLLWTLSSMAGLPMLMKSAPIKSLSDLTPVSQVVNLVYGVYLNPTVPAKNIAELTAYLKANPSKLNYATGPLGEYMMAAHYLKATGTQAARIPYKGGAQIMPDLITGQVQLNFGPLAAGLPHVRAGKLRLLATVPQRMSGVQDVPSLNEAGIPTDDIPLWNGLMAPPNTPREIASRIAMEVAKALKNPELLKSLEAQGLMAVGGTPEAMNTAIQSATQSWRNFIRDYDIPQE